MWAVVVCAVGAAIAACVSAVLTARPIRATWGQVAGVERRPGQAAATVWSLLAAAAGLATAVLPLL